MAIATFLAMTAAEICKNPQPADKIAWMACHFSPYGLGLSNLPQILPPGSLLMVDDITPIGKHDPGIILDQLCGCAETLACSGVLLDFQREGIEETAELVQQLSQALPCPVGVSSFYADVCTCAVCVPPVPLSTPPEDYFQSWKGREIWLELSTQGECISVTEEGASFRSLPCPVIPEREFQDDTLFCHYHILPEETEIKFLLRRTEEDLIELLKQSEQYGVTTAIGLYQEFYCRK